MATFNVFVEGAVDDSPMGLPELAETMSERYGLPATELVSRLKRGRFRVKSKLDRTTAERYRADLESIGARVVIEDSDLSPTATPYAGVQTPARGPNMSLPPLNVHTPPAPRGGRDLGPAGKSTTEPPPVTRPASGLGPAGSTEPPPIRAMHAQPNVPTVPTNPTRTSIVELPVGTAVDVSTPRSAGVTGPPTSQPRTQLPASPSTGRPTPVSGLAAAGARTTTPPANAPPTPSRPDARPTTPPTGVHPPGRAATGLDAAGPAPAARTNAQPLTSGLSAAFSQEVATPTNLGALGENDVLSLGSLDDDAVPTPVTVTITSPVRSGAAAADAKPAAPSPPAASLDLFAPPDAEEAAQNVDLATDEIEDRARRRASVPPESKPAPATSTKALMPSTPRPPQHGGVSLAARPPMPKPRFIAGVALSVLLAFVPVHFIAAMREASAFAEIDREVEQTQASADTPETYAALDGFRAKQIEAKEGAQRSIAMTSMLLWAVLTAGVAFVWFRKIPWDELGKRAHG